MNLKLGITIYDQKCHIALQAILVTGVVVDQYSWSSGFAANLGLMLNSSEWIELRGEVPLQMCPNNFFIFQSLTAARKLSGRMQQPMRQKLSQSSLRRSVFSKDLSEDV